MGLFSLPVDPSDEIYRYLDLWRKKGYIVSLPAVRPYPHQVLINLLGQVESCDDSEARKNARSFLARLVNKPQVFAVSPYQESFISKAWHYSSTGVDFTADGLVKPWLAISVRGGPAGIEFSDIGGCSPLWCSAGKRYVSPRG